jgi:arsenite methyltransferase
MTVQKNEAVYADVTNYYGYRAENEVNLALRARIATALGYDPITAASVPEAANIGEGCGNPLLIANLVEVCC